MRIKLLFCLLTISLLSTAQTMTVITTLEDGQMDTLRFGFVQNATLQVDAALGEENIFMTPVTDYEGRILQRDESNYSCAMELNTNQVYYPDNFDSKVNYRDITDTTIQNRLFELWFSDNLTDSLELICDIPLATFIYTGLLFHFDCFGDPTLPPAILAVLDDTAKHIKISMPLNLGIKQFIFITRPDILIASLEEENEDFAQGHLLLYPNPTKSTFSISHPKPENISYVSIHDLTGSLLEQYESFEAVMEISLESYASGVYVVTCVLKNGKRESHKILKL